MADVFTLMLVAEAAIAVALAKRNSERFMESAAFFTLSLCIATLDAVEIASRISGVPGHLFSITTAQRRGVELASSAEEALADSIKWSYYLSIVNSIALSVVTALLAVKGGAIVAVILAQSGINAVQSLANALVIISATYRFIGQLFTVLAGVAHLLRPLLPVAGLFMIPRSTRRLGATLLTIVISLSLAAPAIVNSLVPRIARLEVTPEWIDDIGVIKFIGFIKVPLARVEHEVIAVEEGTYPMPPGGVSYYADCCGRIVARPLGRWYLEKDSEYFMLGVAYAGFWLPAEGVVFRPEKGISFRVACEEASVTTPTCNIYATNVTEILFNVEAPDHTIVLFYDITNTLKGWGYWKARGFFVLKGSEKLIGPLPWYNVSGFLANHQLVAILDPMFCNYREGNEIIKVKLRSGEEINTTARFVEVTAWVEGHFDPGMLCRNGVPAVLGKGLSRLRVGEEDVYLEPKLSCETTLVEPSLPDARSFEARWFDQWARLINASLPSMLNVSGTKLCLYGRRGIEAIELDGRIYHSRALWPRSVVPKVVVRAKYYGDIVKPAVAGPANAGYPSETLTTILPLISGHTGCSLELRVLISNRMDESAITGLHYDKDLEPLIDGSLPELLQRSAKAILEHLGLLALVEVLLLALILATAILASVAGGFGFSRLFVLKPLHSTLQGLEQLGRSFFSLIKESVATAFRREPLSVKEPSTLTALDPAIEIRRSIERLKRGTGYQRSRLRRTAETFVRSWMSYSGMHPLPALLRAGSEAALRAALSRVKLIVPYEEKLLLALRDPLARRLIVASDTLYAASWLLELKLGMLAPAIRYTKQAAKGLRLLHPREPSERELKRPLRELEKNLASIARAIFEGRDPSNELSKLHRLGGRYPRLRARIERYFKDARSAEEVAARVIALAVREGFTKREFFKLLEKYPAAALPTADRAAMDKAVIRDSWKEAIAAALSQLSRARGFDVDMGAVWLASLDRNEPWRYLVLRIASELAVGREPWFTPKLHPGFRRLLLEISDAWIKGSSSSSIESIMSSEGLDEYAARFLKGYLAALRSDKGSDLERAVEAVILSGDAYWIGYVVALSERRGGAEVLARKIVESLVERHRLYSENPSLLRSVEGFLERAYREVADAIVNVEDRLRVLERYGPLPSPGESVALLTEMKVERGELASRLSDLHQSLNSAISTLEALLAECSNLRQRAYWLEMFRSKWCLEALDRWQSSAARALHDFIRLRRWVEDNLKLLRG